MRTATGGSLIEFDRGVGGMLHPAVIAARAGGERGITRRAACDLHPKIGGVRNGMRAAAAMQHIATISVAIVAAKEEIVAKTGVTPAKGA